MGMLTIDVEIEIDFQKKLNYKKLEQTITKIQGKFLDYDTSQSYNITKEFVIVGLKFDGAKEVDEKRTEEDYSYTPPLKTG